MSINSLYFLVFLAGLYLVYYLICPLKYRWVILLAGSVIFYVSACTASPVYIALTGLCIWGAGLWMERYDAKKDRKKVLTAAVIAVLGLLLVLKYGGFAVRIANRVIAFTKISLPVPEFLVPLGISYYTLIAIGYLMDIYKGKIKAQKNIFKLMLFLAFFPQITQGPMSRYKTLSGQLYEGHRYDYHNLSFGCQRMLWGFFKKLVIADRMQPMVQEIFGKYQNYGGITCFLGCVYMTVWMYADFSGYMDIVAGVAELFGIRLDENFKRPFFAKSLAEYWRRWHISLSGWFRDYMFYPLAVSSPAVKFGKLGRKWFGTRVGKLFPSLFALAFVWFSTGLWHAASMRYIFWGVANGIIIMGAMIAEPWFKKAKTALHIKEKSVGWQWFCMVRTFLVVSALKIFPGTSSTSAMFGFVKNFFVNFRIPVGWEEWFPKLSKGNGLFLAIALLVLFLVDRFEEKKSLREALAGRHFIIRWAWYGFLLVSILCMGEFGVAMTGGFAYAQY